MERDEFVTKIRAALGELPATHQQEILLTLAASFLAPLNPAQLAAVRREVAELHAPRGQDGGEVLDLIDGHLALRGLQS